MLQQCPRMYNLKEIIDIELLDIELANKNCIVNYDFFSSYQFNNVTPILPWPFFNNITDNKVKMNSEANKCLDMYRL